MKHASDKALDRLEALLERIRALGLFVEKKRGVFYRKGRAALHFHEHGDELHADTRGSEETDFTRYRIDTPQGSDALIAALSPEAGEAP